MAEVKNAFIKSKMNKDLDDRLIPNGEYRDALNVQVSKSEASDVGALENVIGNVQLIDYALFYSQNKFTVNTSQTGKSFILNNVIDLKIGMLFPVPSVGRFKITELDKNTNTVTLDLAVDATIGPTSSVQIVYDINCIGYFTDEFNNNVYSFFTDFTDNTGGAVQGYSTQAENFIFRTRVQDPVSTTTLVRGAFLNFSKTKPIIGVNLLEDLLFFTDNRNQPRKINVVNANPNIETALTPTYYTNEDQISVAKYNPYECIRVFSTTDKVPIPAPPSTFITAASSTKVLVVDDSTGIVVGNGVTGTGVKTNTFVVNITGSNITTNKVQDLPDNTNVVFAGLQTTMQDVSTVKLPDGTTDNPYFDANFGGDPDFLEDKFVRFSYRFQFDDGENSIFAPFTQPCFIPKQDGYFIGDDEKDTFSSTIVGFMENKVTKIQLQIPLPANGNLLAGNNSPYKITAIDILYKESDGLAVQVVDTIPIDGAFNTKTGSNNIYQYDYESTKPFKTLPSKELIRVYDKIPVKAFSQEIISNRVVYGNFQDKHTPPEALDYQVAVSDKFSKSNLFSNKTIVEYPNSSVKQNRNYQVGIVLSDKFGRQSSTLLSNNTSPLTAAGFGASTVFSPYQTTGDSKPPAWPGDSLKVLFNGPIASSEDLRTGTPGLYNGDPTSAGYNPLGWFSYKVVVQQKEQDYYNVYNAGAMKGNPLDVTKDLNTSYISLLNDNINKVPRDLSEVGPLQKQFRSSVRLIGRVENILYATAALGNKQFYPGRLTDTTSSIEDLNSIFDVSASTTATDPITDNKNPYFPFYKAESDPLIAQITTTSPFGLVNTPLGGANPTYAAIENLTIFETEPDLSRLDFYFETSTSGLISELNLAVNTDTGGAFGLRNFNLNQNEGMGLGVDATTDFVPTDVTDADIDVSNIVLTSVTDNTGSGSNRKLEWSLIKDASATPNSYKLRTSTTPSLGYQYYGTNAANRNYTFTFAVTVVDAGVTITNSITKTGALNNIAPTIGGGSPQAIAVIGGTTGVISTQTAVNGVNVASGLQLNDLTWSKVDPSIAGNLTINPGSGQITNTSTSVSGVQTIVVRVTDAGGLTADATLNFTFGNAPVPSRFNITDAGFRDGQGITYYFSDNYTNLDAGPHVINPSAPILFRNPVGNTPTSANPSTQAYVCTSPNKYLFKKQYKGASFVTGNDSAFFVKLTTQSNGTFSGNTQSTLRAAMSVEYRKDSTVAWSTAYDINGQLAKFGMARTGVGNSTFVKVRVNNSAALTTSIINPSAQGSGYLPDGQTDFQLDNVTIGSSQNNNTRIFAFDGTDISGNTNGEYRITMGNLTGTVLGYKPIGSGVFPQNVCSNTVNNNGGEQRLEIGDASYGGDNANGVYEYQVSNSVSSNCSQTGNMSIVYAREFITKYVTQFYTTQALTVKKTFSAGSHVFRRTGTTGNVEGAQNGNYVAVFNATGLRTPGSGNATKTCVGNNA